MTSIQPVSAQCHTVWETDSVAYSCYFRSNLVTSSCREAAICRASSVMLRSSRIAVCLQPAWISSVVFSSSQSVASHRLGYSATRNFPSGEGEAQRSSCLKSWEHCRMGGIFPFAWKGEVRSPPPLPVDSPRWLISGRLWLQLSDSIVLWTYRWCRPDCDETFWTEMAKDWTGEHQRSRILFLHVTFRL